ncbi:hypothetical protein J2S43_007432 [Catenuloplanes nepalensis]|uniref:Mucin-associated surface protein n=1 Tax=Catenuloplanes nepalensis TaxID=587533 RepID=A0ABT9N5D8_9ACTN|nr:TadE family type IV pilus minor pilin [Catenuloplanes nepalensis]MDP9798920.1 hypothetical protein [Catenuloplanes nepalensis]
MITLGLTALRYRGRHHHRSRVARLIGAVLSVLRRLSGLPVASHHGGPPAARSADDPPSSARPDGFADDRGAFTAEFAAALPALVLLLGAGLTVVLAVTDRGRCYDAARDAALAAARGESGLDAGTAAAPPGATVTLVPEGEHVRAVVTVPVRALGLTIPEITATGEAVAAIEPGVSVTAS